MTDGVLIERWARLQVYDKGGDEFNNGIVSDVWRGLGTSGIFYNQNPSGLT